jgi:hypothetical protein
MKKNFLKAAMLGMLVIHLNGKAQFSATIPDTPLPTSGTGSGPVLRPQNAGSSTLQNITFNLGGGLSAINNLYVHSWDVFSSTTASGIAWHRTNSAGVLQNQGHVLIPYAEDIDVAIYQDGGNSFVLAAYYFNDPSNPATRGHYYRICSFLPSGLTLGAQTLLTLSSTFGRINVDANTPYGLAIVWHQPGTGIYAKAAQLPGAAFGCNLLLPIASTFQAPDVAVRRSSGVLDLDIAYLNSTNTQIRKSTISLFNVVACSTAGFATTYTVNAVSPFRYGVPRIDCPDQFATAKWAITYAEFSTTGMSPTLNIDERIRIAVFNSAFSPVPTNLIVRNIVYVSNFYQQNNPVLAYNDTHDRITVGWITREGTGVIPGTVDNKYLAQYVSDPNPGAPSSISTSLMMVSNLAGGPAPVLAFSGQNVQSGYDGINAAFSQYNTVFPGAYSMLFKHKPFSSATFRTFAPFANDELNTSTGIRIYPVPFENQVSINVSQKGKYTLSIMSIDGKVLQQAEIEAEANSNHVLQSESLPAGLYFISILSPENNISQLEKVIKE